MRVSATDVDEGDNQRITYDLKADRYPTDLDYFRWGPRKLTMNIHELKLINCN